MKELNTNEMEQVNGGIVSFIIGYAAGKAIDGYINWVSSGAGGWTVEYDGRGYSDPLL